MVNEKEVSMIPSHSWGGEGLAGTVRSIALTLQELAFDIALSSKQQSMFGMF